MCQYESREDEGLQLENRAVFTPKHTHTHIQGFTKTSMLFMFLAPGKLVMALLYLECQESYRWTKVCPNEDNAVLMEGQRLNTRLVELKISFYSTFLWVNTELRTHLTCHSRPPQSLRTQHDCLLKATELVPLGGGVERKCTSSTVTNDTCGGL